MKTVNVSEKYITKCLFKLGPLKKICVKVVNNLREAVNVLATYTRFSDPEQSVSYREDIYQFVRASCVCICLPTKITLNGEDELTKVFNVISCF